MKNKLHSAGLWKCVINKADFCGQARGVGEMKRNLNILAWLRSTLFRDEQMQHSNIQLSSYLLHILYTWIVTDHTRTNPCMCNLLGNKPFFDLSHSYQALRRLPAAGSSSSMEQTEILWVDIWSLVHLKRRGYTVCCSVPAFCVQVAHYTSEGRILAEYCKGSGLDTYPHTKRKDQQS